MINELKKKNEWKATTAFQPFDLYKHCTDEVGK